MALIQALAPLVDLIYPPRCPLCGEGIAQQDGLCLACWSELAIPGEPSCATCQRPLGSAEHGTGYGAETRCAPCLSHAPVHSGIAAGTLYNEASRQLVLAFKHGRKIALAPMMARLIVARLPLLDRDWLVVPVPLHRRRIWQRGYNQSGLLAGEIARLTGARLLVDGLVRTRATPPLGGLGRRERAKMLAGAIAPHPARLAQIAGASIILVDDVMTSGATTDACVKVLRRVGARQVRIACFARVLDEAL